MGLEVLEDVPSAHNSGADPGNYHSAKLTKVFD